MKVKVIIEKGKDNRFNDYMDYDELDFGLSGFGKTAQKAIRDFYECYEEAKVMQSREGKTAPELKFEIQYDLISFLDYFRHLPRENDEMYCLKYTESTSNLGCFYRIKKVQGQKRDKIIKRKTPIVLFLDDWRLFW